MTNDLENLREREAYRKNLLIRNWLNGIFMILAAVAMGGLFIYKHSEEITQACYILGLLAVVVKMMEVMFRMPHLIRKPQKSRTHRRRIIAGNTESASEPEIQEEPEDAASDTNKSNALKS